MHRHFRISFRQKPVAFKFLFQFQKIFHDAVVNQAKSIVAVKMRVGVAFGHAAVGGPAGMAQTDRCRRQLSFGAADLAHMPFPN